jgi:probable rRNA maturation factor
MPKLSLSVQYGVAAPLLPRTRLRRWVSKALAMAHEDGLVQCERAAINIRLVGLAEGRRLNADFRAQDHATNVLTFEYGLQENQTILSDVIICLPVLMREAKEQGKSFLDHAAHLTIHGTLHALGYDHIKAKDAKRMESLEIAILATAGINNPYLC